MKIDIKNIHDGPLISRAIVIGVFCAAFFYLGYYWDLMSLREELVTAQESEPDLKKQVEIAIATQGKVKRYLAIYSA